MKYKAVIFDLFGTLVQITAQYENEDNLKQMALVLSIPSDNFIQLWHDTIGQRFCGIFRNYQECIRFICNKLDLSPSNKEIDLAAQTRFELTKKEVMAQRGDAEVVLNTLRSQRIKIGLISNASIETTIVWENTPLSPLFDVALFSCSVGITKPDPSIYYLALEQLAIEPSKCIYVDDNLEPLKGASRIGMVAVLIQPQENSGINPNPINQVDWNGHVISSLAEVMDLFD